MRARFLYSLCMLLLPGVGLAQTEFAGKHCTVKLAFDNRPFAEEVTKFYDRAIEARRVLNPTGGAGRRFHVEIFDDASAHAEAVRRAKEKNEWSGTSSLRGTSANVFNTQTLALLFLKTPIPSAEQCRRCGLTGNTAGVIIDSASSIGSGFMLPHWLRTGISAWRRARIVGVYDEVARSKDAMLAPAQLAVQRAARSGTLPTIQKLEDYGPSMDAVRNGCLQEFFFMMMERHEVVFRGFVADVLKQGIFNRKSSLKDLKKLLPEDTDLDAEFRDHCERLSPEWDRMGMSWILGGAYLGPRNKLVLDGNSGPFRSMLYQAQPTLSRDFSISGRFEFFGGGTSGAVILNFHTPAEDSHRSPAIIAGVSFARSGRVSVRDGAGRAGFRPKVATQGPAFPADKPVPFRVRVKGENMVVEVDGRKVAECQIEADLSQLWGVSCARGTTVIVHDLECDNPGLIASCLENLGDPAKAREARALLLNSPDKAMPLLLARLANSPYLKGAELDPALGLVRMMRAQAAEILPCVRGYLDECDKRQVLHVLDLLVAVAAQAPRTAQLTLMRDPILQGSSRHDIDQVAWQTRCVELRNRLSVDPSASIANLIQVIKDNRVYAREAAAVALGARGAAAAEAVPALLAKLKSRTSLGKGAKDIEVDGKKLMLRDRFHEFGREALLAIAPGDQRLHRIYSDVLLDSKEPGVRIAAAKALGSMGVKVPRAAVTAMVKAFKSAKDDAVLIAIIEAFAQMGRQAHPTRYHLRQIAGKESTPDAVRNAANAAIKKLGR